MIAFLALIKLTLRHALRSHIFHLLLLLLLFWVIGIPFTISGDGTASGFIRISLLYSLSGVSTILALSSIWVGCFVMTHDIDGYQIHMLVSKPVPRIKIWLGKFAGVFLLHFALLLVSCFAVYIMVLYSYSRQGFSEEERTKLNNEVMIGRRVFLPDSIDYDAAAEALLKAKVEQLQASGKRLTDTSEEAQEELVATLRKEIVGEESEIRNDTQRIFSFSNLPTEISKPVSLRYRAYAGTMSSEFQRMTDAQWYVGIPERYEDQELAAGQEADTIRHQIVFRPVMHPQQFMAGKFHEIKVDPAWNFVTPAGNAQFAIWNIDPNGKSLFMQTADGPKLLIEETSFLGNYLRLVIVITMELLILCGIGCTFGGIMTLPTAIFVSAAYVLFGSFATYVGSTLGNEHFSEQLGSSMATLLLWIVIPIQDFELSGLVADGELVEYSLIGMLFLKYFLLRALPLFVIGMILYRRRELGLVLRK